MNDVPQTRPRSIAYRLIRFALLGYAAFLVLLVLMESRLVYPGAYFAPSSVATIDPEIKTVEIADLPCRLIERDNPRHYVLFLHGNGIRAAELDHWTRRLSEAANATVLTAEYRGFEDDRSPTEQGILEDCEAAYQFLVKKYDLSADQVVIYGRSMGGGCAAALASEHGVKALVMDRTFDAMWKVASSMYPFAPVNLLMRNRYDSAMRLADYRGTFIQIHGTKDEVIPIERGKALFDSISSQQKCWIEIPGMRHNDYMDNELLSRVVQQINR